MPHKAKRPCATNGCCELTSGQYCEAHAREASRRYNVYERDPETNKRYDGEWRRISAAYRREQPLCELCLSEGRLTPAELVHHKNPLRTSNDNSRENLQSLCQSCHSRTHAQQRDYF